MLTVLRNQVLDKVSGPMRRQGMLLMAFLRRAIRGVSDAAIAVREAEGAVEQAAHEAEAARLAHRNAVIDRRTAAIAAGMDAGAHSTRKDEAVLRLERKHEYMQGVMQEAARALERATSLCRMLC